MKWIQPYFLGFFLFLLVPILIHWFKKSTQKIIQLSSLYLLQRKSHFVYQNFKFNQLLLLLSRLSIVALLSFFALKPILPFQINLFGFSIFPHKKDLLVFIDTRFDSKENSIKSFSSMFSKEEANLEIKEIKAKSNQDLFAKLNQNSSKTKILISRFYGFSEKEIKNLKKQNIKIFPIGPKKISNARFSNMKLSPKKPFLGENIKLSGNLISNIKNSPVLLQFYDNGNLIKTLSFQKEKNSGFNQTFPVTESGLKNIELKISKDEFDLDNLYQKEIKITSNFNVAFIDDFDQSTKKTSRLYYIRKFFNLIQNTYPKVLFSFNDLNSKEFKESKKEWDWAIYSNLKTFPNFLGKNNLVFSQKNKKIQALVDKKLKIHSYQFLNKNKTIEILNLNPIDKLLFNKPWKINRYLQFKPLENYKKLIQSNSEVFSFQKGNTYFFGFDFTEYEFSGIHSSFFPIFLYRLFLNRWEKENKFKIESFSKDPFSRLENINKKGFLKIFSSETDFSFFALIFLFIFLILELVLIKKLEGL